MSHPLLSLAPSEGGPAPSVLRTPGGFAWWYLDLTGEQGDGLVLIWSFGLPFLPGYLGSARSGRPQRPIDRPSLNVVVYRAGKPVLYLLQEYAPEAASWDGATTFRFGDSTLVTEVRRGRRVVSVTLDCPLPGSDDRLTGRVLVEGPAASLERNDAFEESAETPHRWSVLVGPGLGVADLRAGGRCVLRQQGRAYHDRNFGTEAFDALGIEHWIWGRVPLDDRELVYYLVWPVDGREPELRALSIDDRGHVDVRDVEVELRDRRLARWGMPYWRTLILREGGRYLGRVELESCVDDGPFYLRFFSRGWDARGRSALGTTELVRPGRVDRGLERPLVRMRVHRVDGKNSPFLPLFAGPATGRVGRLLGGWMRGGTT